MIEKRYNYNPYTKKIFLCSESHSLELYKRKKQKNFDDYIRLIILNDVLYIRLYYPFKDLESLTYNELKEKSLKLIKLYEENILKQLKNEKIKKIVYNADNDLLKGKLTNI